MRYTSWTRKAFKRAAKRNSKNPMIPYYYRKKYKEHPNTHALKKLAQMGKRDAKRFAKRL